MTNKFIPTLCACLLSVTVLALGIYAEDYEDASAASGSDSPPVLQLQLSG